MAFWEEGYEENDEVPDEYLEEETDEVPEEVPEERDEREIPDVWWKDDLEKIYNPRLREREIEAAEKLFEKRRDLEERLESGEITKEKHVAEVESGLRRKEADAAARASLATEGITHDHIVDKLEDHEFAIMGFPGLIDKKRRIRERIDRYGPEAEQERADQMLKEREINERAHEIISRQVRLHGM